MTTAVAPPPTTAALAPPALEPAASSRSCPALAPASAAASPSSSSKKRSPPSTGSPPQQRTPSDGGKSSPPSLRPATLPKVVVKKEPASPEMTTARHRPRRLDLSKGAANGSANGQPSAGLRTAKESAGLAIKDVGIACLSPGFHTHDPTMQEQLQRSLSVREQQRLLIEARQKGSTSATKTTPPGHSVDGPASFRPAKTPATSKRRGPPPGLSIAPPSHESFANERVVQSAPLNQTFTGLQRNVHPMTRHVTNQPSSLSNTSHIHHVPATQTNNRLPPIADVFAGDNLPAAPQSSRANVFPHAGATNTSPGHSSHSNHQPPLPSPGLPRPHNNQQQPSPYPSATGQGPQYSQQSTARTREYKSAEEALKDMTGGREELLPRLVHYGGHQPPTPPSPMPHQAQQSGAHAGPSSSGRRRDRDEFERDMSPQQQGRRKAGGDGGGFGREEREARWVEGRWPNDSPDTRERKKDEFLSLCSRAWDLFHS